MAAKVLGVNNKGERHKVAQTHCPLHVEKGKDGDKAGTERQEVSQGSAETDTEVFASADSDKATAQLNDAF